MVTMTVKERASIFLRAHPSRDLCDRCLGQALGVHASTGHRAAVKIARSDRFTRAYGQCSNCGETRFVTRALH
jgi:ribosomal protein S27AE